MDALVRGGQELFQTEFARAVAKAARMGQAQQLHARVVHQLQKILAVEGEQRRVHHLKNARQQGRRFQRSNALLLQQVRQCVYFGGQLSKCIAGPGATRAK